MSDRAQVSQTQWISVVVASIVVTVTVQVAANAVSTLPAAPPEQLVGPPGVFAPPALNVQPVALGGLTAALLVVGVGWSYWEVRRHDAR